MFQYHSIIIINNNSVSVILNSISVADLLGDTLFERYTHQEFFNLISHQSHFGLDLSIILLIYLSLFLLRTRELVLLWL